MVETMVIPLTRGYTTIIDKEDFNKIKQFKWWAREKRGKVVAITSLYKNGKHWKVRMHRLLVGAPSDKQIDHKNGNTLDNRKENLRLCSNSENLANRGKPNGKFSSKFKGVYFDKRSHRWIARVVKNYKTTYCGSFESEGKAALAYDTNARKLFGEFAYENFK